MKKHAQIETVMVVVFFAATSAFAGVTVSNPANGSTVGTSVKIVATANTSCSKGVASMGIYPASNWLVYTVNGSSLNTSINLNPGTYNVVIEEWDNCGGASTATVKVNVQSGSGVHITSPSNGSTVGSPVNFVATATTDCSKGVASMGIYTAPYQLAYVKGGASLNTSLSLSAGTYHATVQEWDNCGGASSTPVTITVSSSGKIFWNVHGSGGWKSYAQQPPNYGDCTWCTPSGPQTTWAMYQGVKNPTMTGNSTQYNIGGTEAYTDVLWNNHLIGDLSSQGLPDSNHTLVPTLHNFTYDVYFWGNNLGASQALEFDVNQFFGGMGFTWGTECRLAGGYEWDVWNDAGKWLPTGIPCNPNNNSWNHLVLQVQRTSDNKLTYQSITLNGQTHVLNWTYRPFSAPGWYGVTINYQMDGNYKQTPYTVFVDKLNITYQ
jgi:major membrane immunogen (membrane-anchored lipoprotein)